MSEYQYYEFLAMDRPLNDGEQRELRSLSTRADITPTRFVNEYHWGDFRGDPRALVERYFDAYFYFANWGSRILTLRLPRHLLDLETAEQYAVPGLISVWATDDHVIIEFSGGEDPEDEIYNEDWELASIIGVRGELAAGDLRALYMGWLLGAQIGMLDDDELEPPVPPGMNALTGAQRGFADFFRVDEDMITVGAAASQAAGSGEIDEEALAHWIQALPVQDKDAMLLRVVQGNDVHLRTELLRKFHGPDANSPGTRTVAEVLDAADSQQHRRIQAEREKQAEAERLRAEQAAIQRRNRLEWLARNEEPSWQEVYALIDTRKPAEYDKAVNLLVDLKALSEQQGQVAEFGRRFGEIRDQHRLKVSLLDRFTMAGLG